MGFTKNYFSDILKKGISTLAFKVLGVLLGYAMILFITKNFGAEVYGKFSLSLVFSQVLALVFTFGFPSFVVTLLTNKLHFDRQLKTNFFDKVVAVTVVVGLLMAVLLYLFSYDIAVTLFRDAALLPFIKLLSFLILPLMLHEVFLGYLKGTQQFGLHNLCLFILPPVFFFLSYFVIDYWFVGVADSIVFLCYTLGIVAVMCLEFFLIKRANVAQPLRNIPIQPLMKRALPMMYSAAVLYMLGWTDIFMLKMFRTSKEVGVYHAVFKVASAGFLIITAINIVIMPKIADLYIKKEIEALHKMIVKTTHFVMLLTLPFIIGVIIFREEILAFFGAEFVVGKAALLYIIIGVFISVSSGVVDQILNMTNHQQTLKKIIISSFLINVVLNYVLIPKFGIEGAAIASLFTNAFLNITCIFFIKKKLGFFTFI